MQSTVDNYTTAAAGLSTAEAFAAEIFCSAVFSRKQEQELVDRARGGSLEAYHRLVEGCQRYIFAVASRSARYYWARTGVRMDLMDLLMAANIAILEQRESVLSSKVPAGYMRQVAKHVICITALEQSTFLRVPRTSYLRGRRAPDVLSLDAPYGDDGATLADLIAS